ncbi:hypothetical protein ACOKWN_003805 [Vibrio parahaemolyticus]
MSSKNDSDRNRLLQLANLKTTRSMTLLSRFFTLFLVVMCAHLLNLIFVLLDSFGVNWNPNQDYLELYRSAVEFLSVSSGFIFAELVRRSTVNPKTDDLRPYTWKEIFRLV